MVPMIGLAPFARMAQSLGGLIKPMIAVAEVGAVAIAATAVARAANNRRPPAPGGM